MAIRDELLAAYAVPSMQFGTGPVDVPCGPGGYAARIDYDANGPILDTQFQREEYALAMEERFGDARSDDALAAYTRRVSHLLGLRRLRR